MPLPKQEDLVAQCGALEEGLNADSRDILRVDPDFPMEGTWGVT